MTFSLTCPDRWKHTQMSTGVAAAQVVYTKTAQEENNPRTPATSLLGRWWSPSNARVPVPPLQSWEEGGAWAGHTHTLHSHASPAALYHLFSYYAFPSPLNKGPQWRWAGGGEARIMTALLLTEWCWESLKRSSHIGAEVDGTFYDHLVNITILKRM